MTQNEEETPSDKPKEKHISQKSLLSILRSILRKEGVLGLYKGLDVALAGSICSYGIYFWWYRYFKNIMSTFKGGSQKFTSAEVTIITAGAGIIGSVMTNPFWFLNTRMTLRKDKNTTLMDMIKLIYEKEGPGAFFKGVLPNLILVLNPIINFVVYEFLKRFAMQRYKSEKNIPYSTIFTMSSIGKCMATLVTYPILTIRVKQQADKSSTIKDKREEP